MSNRLLLFRRFSTALPACMCPYIRSGNGYVGQGSRTSQYFGTAVDNPLAGERGAYRRFLRDTGNSARSRQPTGKKWTDNTESAGRGQFSHGGGDNDRQHAKQTRLPPAVALRCAHHWCGTTTLVGVRRTFTTTSIASLRGPPGEVTMTDAAPARAGVCQSITGKDQMQCNYLSQSRTWSGTTRAVLRLGRRQRGIRG